MSDVKDKAPKKSGKKKADEEQAPVYTFASCGVQTMGISIWGYKSRDYMIARWKRQLEKQQENIAAALEAIESNHVRVEYRHKGQTIPAGLAGLLQRKLDKNS